MAHVRDMFADVQTDYLCPFSSIVVRFLFVFLFLSVYWGCREFLVLLVVVAVVVVVVVVGLVGFLFCLFVCLFCFVCLVFLCGLFFGGGVACLCFM